MNNRRRGGSRPSVLKWFGNMSVLSDFLNSKSWFSGWCPVKVIDTYFRALGVVVFANNPFTGILIFAGIMMGNPMIGLTTFVASTIAIFTCKLIQAPNDDVCSGVAVFNTILLGGVVTAVAPMVLQVPHDAYFWIALACGSVITVFVDQGFQAMMAPSRLPVQSVPFNFVATILLLVLRSRLHGFYLEDTHREDDVMENLLNVSNNFTESTDWVKVVQGTVLAAGQVYGIESIKGSILVWMGYILYSPILAVLLYMGSVVGGVGATVFNLAPLFEIYLGLWSYNSMLAAGGIAFFVVPSPLGILAALVNAIIAVSVQAAIMPVFLQTAVPILSFPFNVAIMLILAISLRKESPLQYVENRTFPEEHLCKFYNFCGGDSEDLENSEATTAEPLSISAKFVNDN